MANLNQLAIDSKSKLLSEQVLLYVEREMKRELRMTRILIDLCHEVTDAVKDKAELIKEVKELGVAAQGSDNMAYLRILRDEDLAKVKDIMNLIKETQKHTRENLYVLDVEVCGMLGVGTSDDLDYNYVGVGTSDDLDYNVNGYLDYYQ
ncbi:hypothetical protein Tco_1078389 [Tanacetum coccineum]|uniref:Uncharacterized protein n=1 Tax=Tanacetum coccineum TaxID=301880 RepID=A0ABQ5HNZ6_9ASTR